MSRGIESEFCISQRLSQKKIWGQSVNNLSERIEEKG
jgi:hypothetical protein